MICQWKYLPNTAKVKRNYSSTAPGEVYTVSVPGLAQNPTLGINKRGKLLLKSGDVKEILEPVVAEVVRLVLEQIKATDREVKSILLVGGFGGNKYLHERIQAAVKNTVEVIKPPYAWSAVVQGALIKGLAHYDQKYATVRLSSRAARKHLGILVHERFDKDIHLESQKSVTYPCISWI
jgi:tRNA A37 threonylcarbamoyltransferase TsaD